MAILNDDEFTEFEGRSYLNPQVALDESNTFIDNLRQTQQANNEQIKTDTYNLGTAVPSNLGGLTGPESYFSSRYQVPQTNAAVSELRAAAQANALNQILQNEQDMWKKRYQDAYNAYQKRAWDKNNGGGGGDDDGNDDPEFESTGESLSVGANELVLPEPSTTDTGVVSSANAMADITGQGKVPTTTTLSGVLVDKNGNRTAFRIYPGQGIEVPNAGSFTKEGARSYLQNWVKSGGKVSNGTNAPMNDNLSTNMLAWDLY